VVIDDILKAVVEKDASDVILKAGCPPMFRIYGDLVPSEFEVLDNESCRKLIYSILTPERRARFERDLELDLAYSIEGLARFRVNVFQQRETIGGCFRAIPLRIKTMEELNLPQVCADLAMKPRGLVLVTGPTGSGKTTTLAAMLDYRNAQESCHIMTMEDPVEFVYQDKEALVNQRELGEDTYSFSAALRAVLRQDPDVILVGEMRDLETISLAITSAETGHLVFGTLHTTDAVQTVDRIIDVFPIHQQAQVRMQLSVNLLGVISQMLCRKKEGNGRVAAFEVMVASSAVRNMIREAKTHQIASTLQTGSKLGMMTLDQCLLDLYTKGMVTKEEALSKVHNPQAFEQMLAQA